MSKHIGYACDATGKGKDPVVTLHTSKYLYCPCPDAPDAPYFLRAGACSMAISCCCIAHLVLCKRVPRAMLVCLCTVLRTMHRNALCSCMHAHPSTLFLI